MSRASSHSASARAARRPRPCSAPPPRSRGTSSSLRTLYLLGILIGVGVAGFWLLARRDARGAAAAADRPPAVLRDARRLSRRERHRPRRCVRHALRARAAHRRHALARRRVPPRRSHPSTRRCSGSRRPARSRSSRRRRCRDTRSTATSRAFLSVPVDLAHTLSAAVWFGGLVALVFALPRATADDDERDAIVAPVLDGRARVGDRARAERPRPRADRARRRDADLVDVVRPRADHQDGALRAVARARLAEPLAAPRQPSPGCAARRCSRRCCCSRSSRSSAC